MCNIAWSNASETYHESSHEKESLTWEKYMLGQGDCSLINSF